MSFRSIHLLFLSTRGLVRIIILHTEAKHRDLPMLTGHWQGLRRCQWDRCDPSALSSATVLCAAEDTSLLVQDLPEDWVLLSFIFGCSAVPALVDMEEYIGLRERQWHPHHTWNYSPSFCVKYRWMPPNHPARSVLTSPPWIFIKRSDAEAEAPILWPHGVKGQLIGKDPDAGKDWGQKEKGATEDQMVG